MTTKNSSKEQVAEFHRKFKHPINEKPTLVDRELRMLRIKLIAEELGEFAEGCGMSFTYIVHDTGGATDMVEIADALGDLDYVVQGANLVFGLPSERILEEIHASNMSKLGTDGEPIYRADGKVLKGPHYFQPQDRIKTALAEATAGERDCFSV